MHWKRNRSRASGRSASSAAVVIVTVGLFGAVLMASKTSQDADLPIEPPPTAPPTATTSTTTVPDARGQGVLLGASTSPDRRGSVAERLVVEELEQRLGRTLDINHNFYPWDTPFPTDAERWDLEAGRIPLISWNGRDVTTAAIAAGHHDSLIRRRAHDTRALGRPVLIRWFWEMDGNKKAEFAGAPGDYVAAWRRIVTLFRTEGADNVDWVWCPNASAFNDGEAQKFYPGDDFVDWTCADGYNWAPGRPGDDYRSFQDIFGGFYVWATLHDKPIMIGEFGVQERHPGEKAQWIADARHAIKTDFPRLRAIVYFNSNKDYDWRVTTSESALEAFRNLAHDPWFHNAAR
jgi:hypothetical protein